MMFQYIVPRLARCLLSHISTFFSFNFNFPFDASCLKQKDYLFLLRKRTFIKRRLPRATYEELFPSMPIS